MIGRGCNGCLAIVNFSFVKDNLGNLHQCLVRDDSKLLNDSGEVPNSKWSGWRFDSRHEIFSLYLTGEKKKQIQQKQAS